MMGSRATLRWVLTTTALAAALAVGAPEAGANAKPPVGKPAAECKSSPAVVIDAGTMTNTTNVNLSANGGTGIADASGGDDNLSQQGGDGGVSAAGNGGGADAGASGGATATESINSGGNMGTAIGVGNTWDGALCDGVPAVMISGGEVVNTTNVNVEANGGTAIADASGGDGNVAVGGGRAGNGGGGVVGAGNGGGATAAANGGAVSVGEINSGGNAGNVITVGNTVTGGVLPVPEKPWKPGKPVVTPGKPGKPGIVVVGKPAKIKALPSTGAGAVDAGLVAAIAAAGSAAAAGLGLRRR